ncbi:MAG: aldose 1-epimerase family protein [Clostridia bacterium]|nr:aldose 1-epimerase family protein [Clostridia bacterium]
MAKLYGREFTKQEIRSYVGNISNIAGAKRYILKEGKADGVEAVDVKTGTGFNFTVLPGRGMDIAWVDYCGIPISWMSKAGIGAAKYFENDGICFLRNFFGGLLTTCGLTHAGGPQEDNGEKLGLHGRISNIPANNVSVEEYWDEDDLFIKVKGKVRQAMVFGENLVLTREITAKLGESKLYIHDTVENEGYNETPFMLLYHMNFSYPVVSEDSRLIVPSIKVEPATDIAEKGIDKYNVFQAPTPGYLEQVFFHMMPKDKGLVKAALVNDKLKLGAYVQYSPEQLPYFTQWKQMGQQDYVVGLEPGNCIPEGRVNAREGGRLQILKPGDKKEFCIEAGVLWGKEQIDTLE